MEFNDGKGKVSTNFIDLYKRHCFALEAKQGAEKAVVTEAEIPENLVALTKERAAEEANGLIRWLRPEYQNPLGLQ